MAGRALLDGHATSSAGIGLLPVASAQTAPRRYSQRTMSTRRLIILSLLCGVAILVAFMAAAAGRDVTTCPLCGTVVPRIDDPRWLADCCRRQRDRPRVVSFRGWRW